MQNIQPYLSIMNQLSNINNYILNNFISQLYTDEQEDIICTLDNKDKEKLKKKKLNKNITHNCSICILIFVFTEGTTYKYKTSKTVLKKLNLKKI
jgi:hypothetical protein